MVAILCWLIGSLVGAGVLALFVYPSNESYWPSVASNAGILLIMIAAFGFGTKGLNASKDIQYWHSPLSFPHLSSGLRSDWAQR